MKTPLVSVVVPVYNGKFYLDEALQSIVRQDYSPIEIIVVDDGSTDKSAGIARSYRDVRYIYQANEGTAAALNRGIEAADGQFLAFLPADDLWVENKLSLQIEYLIDHPETGFVLCHQRTFFQEGIEKPSWAVHLVYRKESPCFGFGAMLARKTVFEKAGGYDPGFRYGENAEWLTRAKLAGIGYVVLPETLLQIRIHNQNLTHHQERMRAGIIGALKASIERKRRQSSSPKGDDEQA